MKERRTRPEGLELQPGLVLLPGYFEESEQKDIVAHILAALKGAPFFTPLMPRTGKPFSVRMSNFGPLGWVSDKAGGYRYQPLHPETGEPWPSMPPMLAALWQSVAAPAPMADACLVNYYTGSARMGLHQDRDEETFDAPVVSVSLGDSAVFRFKGESRSGPSRSVRLHSGDVVVMGGQSRLCHHGIDRVLEGSSRLLDEAMGGGRINLTLRRVRASPSA